MATEQGASPPGGWELSDAWILAAIGAATRHGDLRDLLAAADHLNHAVPTEAEVRQGVGRLLASGLVADVGDRWVPTPRGRALASGVVAGGFERVTALLDAMASVPLVEGAWEVPPGALERAYHRYTHPLTWMLPTRPRRRSTRGRH